MGGLKGLRLLLDTHVIIWCAADPEKIPEEVAREIESDNNELWFSPISIWEILLLAEKKRINLKPDPEKGVRNLIKQLPFKEAAINQEVAIISRRIELPHNDPADRFLAATAIVYDLVLVTADKRLLSSGQYSVMPIK
jgi:PIN domain nuclease of toxin-antitoxin system